MTMVFLLVACFQAWREEHDKIATVGPRYALVSSDGTILEQKNFSEYGLAVKTVEEHTAEGSTWTVYHLQFAHEPEHFEIRTNDGATPGVDKIGPQEYRVVFVGVGFGSPVVTANFRVNVF